jgi:hypothetical protein
MALIAAAAFGSLALVFVLLPFFRGPGGLLQEASATVSLEFLLGTQERLLERYLQDEMAAHHGEISKTAWSQRKAYLTGRYIDVTRRIDYLRATIT